MKKSIIYLFLIVGGSLFSQDKIAEFVTTKTKVAGYMLRTKVKFELWKDSLVLTQIDKKIVKSFRKKGLPLSTIYRYSFAKTETPYEIQYTYQNETEDFQIITESNARDPMVRIRTKDTFSGNITDVLYFSN